MAHPNLPRLALAILAGLGSAGAGAAPPAGLGDWHGYALAQLTPAFDWADRGVDEVVPSVTDQRALFDATGVELLSLRAEDGTRFALAIGQRFSRDGSVEGSAARLTHSGLGLERTTLTPSMSRSLSGGGTLSAAVVLTTQQFASWGFGSGTRLLAQPSAVPSQRDDVSYGSGLRLSMAQPLSDTVDLVGAFQSRIDMDAFQNYRGIYSEPGDFDLPAIASVGVSWKLGAHATLGASLSRIGYGDIAPFTSSALPSSLLALIGDGTSPVFAWRDLTVGSLDWSWRPTASTNLMFRYSTQQQPEPTSRLLAFALSDRFTDRNFSVSLAQSFARGASFELHAGYAPVPYFLGNTSYAERSSTGDQLEVEALWSVPF